MAQNLSSPSVVRYNMTVHSNKRNAFLALYNEPNNDRKRPKMYIFIKKIRTILVFYQMLKK